jgi:uncharacterized membrane protein
METVLGATAVILLMYASIAVPLWLADRAERARVAARARQVGVTDAIHGQVGAVVSPVVSARLWGQWRVSIPVGRGQERLLGTILDIAVRTMARFEDADGRRARGFEIVVMPSR